MPLSTTVTIPGYTWTPLTAGDVSALRVQLQSDARVHLMATVGAVAPASTAGSLILRPFETWAANLLLAELFGGVPGATRLYAYADNTSGATLSVSHA